MTNPVIIDKNPMITDKKTDTAACRSVAATLSILSLGAGFLIGSVTSNGNNTAKAEVAKNSPGLIDYDKATAALKSHHTLADTLLELQVFLGGAGQHGDAQSHQKFFSGLASKMKAEAERWFSEKEQYEFAVDFRSIERKLELIAKEGFTEQNIHGVMDSCQKTQQELLKLIRP